MRSVIGSRSTFGRLLFALPLLLLAWGCRANSLEGKWRATNSDGPGEHTLTFRGGEMEKVVTVNLMGAATFEVTGKGTYAVEGDVLKQSITDVKVQASRGESKMEVTTPLVVNAAKGQLTGHPNVPLKFSSPDEIELTEGDKVHTFRRVE